MQLSGHQKFAVLVNEIRSMKYYLGKEIRNLAESNKFKTVKKNVRPDYAKLVKNAKFTYDEDFPNVTVQFLKDTATHTVRKFIRLLLPKIFSMEELDGKQATSRKPKREADGTRAPVKEAIDEKRRNFIFGKSNFFP